MHFKKLIDKRKIKKSKKNKATYKAKERKNKNLILKNKLF